MPARRADTFDVRGTSRRTTLAALRDNPLTFSSVVTVWPEKSDDQSSGEFGDGESVYSVSNPSTVRMHCSGHGSTRIDVPDHECCDYRTLPDLLCRLRLAASDALIAGPRAAHALPCRRHKLMTSRRSVLGGRIG
jgi:hypothetical protein